MYVLYEEISIIQYGYDLAKCDFEDKMIPEGLDQIGWTSRVNFTYELEKIAKNSLGIYGI